MPTVVAVFALRRVPKRLPGAALALLVLSTLAAPSAALADDPTDTTATGGGASAARTAVTARKGDRGSAVKRIQRKLGLNADGVFGPLTGKAVKRFQRRRGLTADGIVGPITRKALGLAPFSSSSVRHPRQSSGPRANSQGLGSLPAVLKRIAQCESGGNPRAISSGGDYRGKYQFMRSTWKANGGRGSDPAKASEREQDRIALRLYRKSGIAPWPACGRDATD